MQFGTVWKVLTRKKPLTQTYCEESELPRVLGLIDLTALGVASTLGMGVYIMAGSIARLAGPGASISFLIAGIAAALSALCYGEFAARVPKAGSAYVYSYVAVGEFVAFVVGWNLALEYVIGTACVARGLSNYIDALIGDRISNFLSESLPMNYPYLAEYPDFFAFFIMMVFSCLLAFGVVLSSNFNKLFTTVNLTTISLVVLAGAYKADLKNWWLSPSDIPEGKDGGVGGFLPFGVAGVFSGAAKCFYAYTGFDCVATTGEEAKNPQKLVPLALILTLFIAFVAYLGISTSVTLMWPYYDQSVKAPFPYVFDKTGLHEVKWAVTIGALCALCACMVSSIYGTSRIIYSMACDGLLFKSLSYVSEKLQTPITATFTIGVFTGTISLIFDMDMLIDMTSIGTLTAYTIVSMCVLLLRYEKTAADDLPVPVLDEQCITKSGVNNPSFTNDYHAHNINNADGCVNINAENHINSNLLKLLFNHNYQSDNYKKLNAPTYTTSAVVKWMTVVFLISTCILCYCLTTFSESLLSFNPALLILTFISLLVLLLSLISISRQPKSKETLTFKVRFVPLIPAASSFMNIMLMMMLNLQTWIRFTVWMLIGFFIYFGYGITHSKETQFNRNERKKLHKIKMISDTNHQLPTTPAPAAVISTNLLQEHEI